MSALASVDERIREKCGLAGVFYLDSDTTKSAAFSTYVMMNFEQGRGNQGAGIVAYDQKYRKFRKVFAQGEVAVGMKDVKWEEMTGRSAIGHLLYSTVQNFGLPKTEYIQPIRSPSGEFYLGHNGTVEPQSFKNLMEDFGATKNDSELIVKLIDDLYGRNGGDWRETLSEANEKLDGSYTCEMLTKNGEIILFREPKGLKPLHYSEMERENRLIGYAFASETSAIRGIEHFPKIKSVEPGTYVIIREDGAKAGRFAKPMEHAHCSFEWVYFQNFTSSYEGISNDLVRRRLGAILAKKDEGKTKPDSAGPVPDSGRSAAIGYSEEAGVPFREYMMTNKGRTFIQSPDERMNSVKMKYSINKDVVMDKSIVIVDDSLVRGTTMKKLVKLVRRFKPKRVDVRISYPQIKFPCYGGGIAFSKKEELATNNHDLESLRKEIDADSLVYTTEEDLKQAIGINDLCMACVNGKYQLNCGVKTYEEMEKRVFGLKSYVSG